jgi:hypothetical protein
MEITPAADRANLPGRIDKNHFLFQYLPFHARYSQLESECPSGVRLRLDKVKKRRVPLQLIERRLAWAFGKKRSVFANALDSSARRVGSSARRISVIPFTFRILNWGKRAMLI